MNRTNVVLNTTLYLLVIVVMLLASCGVAQPDRPNQAAFTDPAAEVAPDSAETEIQAPRADPDGLVAAWNRALHADHALTGTIELTVENVVESETRLYAVRRARLGDRELDQTSTSALITVGSTNTACEEASNGQFMCSASEQGLSTEERFDRIREAIDGASARYEASAIASAIDGSSCWLVERRPRAEPLGWGDRTTFCFDDLVGVISFQETLRDNRIERFTADGLTNFPTEHDLDPVANLTP